MRITQDKNSATHFTVNAKAHVAAVCFENHYPSRYYANVDTVPDSMNSWGYNIVTIYETVNVRGIDYDNFVGYLVIED